MLSDSVAEMTLGTMIPNNDCPSWIAGGAGGDEARQQNNVPCIGQRTKLSQKEKIKDQNALW